MPPQWLGRESLCECSGSLKWTQPTVMSSNTRTGRGHASACRASEKRTVLRLDLWSQLTRLHQAPFYAALLELNSVLKLKTLRSSLTVNPTNAP